MVYIFVKVTDGFISCCLPTDSGYRIGKIFQGIHHGIRHQEVSSRQPGYSILYAFDYSTINRNSLAHSITCLHFAGRWQ